MISQTYEHEQQQGESMDEIRVSNKSGSSNGISGVGKSNYRYNAGVFVMFVMRQWGQKLDEKWMFVLEVALAVVLDAINDPTKTNK